MVPTADERARAEMLAIFKLGMYMLARYAVAPPPDGHPADLDIPAITDRFTVPALELFTYGLYRTTDYLDAFRAPVETRQTSSQTSTESRQS